MRFSRRTRRVSLTALRGALLASGAAAVVALLPSAAHAVGSDDYPANLRTARQDSLVDPWRFYNRECTSFVAWRLNHDSGIPFTNHYLGPHWGDARIWKQAALDSGVTVDGSPVVGSVAWWSAGSVGSSHGHVAYVDKVLSSSIVIEEYNYLRRGYYDTRTIPVTSGSWPSGFIHVGDTALSNVSPPTVAGTARVGSQLTAGVGRWTPSGAAYHYQWYAGSTAIAGATASRFVPTAAQLSRRVSVQVTASKAGVSPASAVSTRTTRVAPGLFTASAAPAVVGTAKVGVPLLATTGTWSPGGGYSFQWSVGGRPVAGATAMSYTPVAADLDKPITVSVTAALPGYTTATSTSAATVGVVKGDFAATAPPTVTGTPQVDQTLSGSTGTWAPAGSYSFQWFAGGVAIPGATRGTYVPTPATVDKPLVLQVTARAAGFNDKAASSAVTAPVLRGTFTEVAPPTAPGVARVGVPLTGAAGSWAPRPGSVAYQWYADGTAIPGADAATFTPIPAEFGKRLSLRVSVLRDGYTTASDTVLGSAPVAAGHVTNLQRPTVAGAAYLGRALRATSGTWSVDPAAVGYQWLRDGAPIPGATSAAYLPAEADVEHRIAVRITDTTPGYDPAAATSAATAPVLRGVARVTGGVQVGGTPVVGHTLWVRRPVTSPAGAAPQYQWFRGARPIRGATGSRYVVAPEDLGHRLRAVVTLAPSQWLRHSTRSVRTPHVTERPRVHATARRQGRTVALDVSVLTRVTRPPHGSVVVGNGRRVVGTLAVVRGAGRLVVDVPRRWTTLQLAYSGSYLVGARTVTVDIGR